MIAVALIENISRDFESIGAIATAAASIFAGILALGHTRKTTKRIADDDCKKRVEDMVHFFNRGVEFGKQIER